MKTWEIGEIIRTKNGHPYLVVSRNDICSLVIDLFEKEKAHSLIAILVKDYPDFIPDCFMRAKETRIAGESYVNWEEDKISEKLQGVQAWL